MEQKIDKMKNKSVIDPIFEAVDVPREVAVDLCGVTKVYQMYEKASNRLKEALNPFRKKYHEDFYALNEINIHVYQGEMIGFLGENGS